MTDTIVRVRFGDRRVRFDRVDDAPEPYQRVVEEWTGCRWRLVGREFVATVDVEVAPATTGAPDAGA